MYIFFLIGENTNGDEMENINGNTYWNKVKGRQIDLSITGKHSLYPYLLDNIKTDILIIGGGITGAITAYYLSSLGKKVTLIEKNIIGMGNTRFSNAYIDYQSKTLLKQIQKQKNTSNSILYDICFNSTYDLEYICFEINQQIDRVSSLLYTRKRKQTKTLKEEYQIRKYCEFDVDYSESFTSSVFKSGFYTKRSSVQINPYEFTLKLLDYLTQNDNIKIYENTQILNCEKKESGYILETNTGISIISEYVIWATGNSFPLKYRIPGLQIYRKHCFISKVIDNPYQEKISMREYKSNINVMLTSDKQLIYCFEDKRTTKNCKKQERKDKRIYRKITKDIQKLFPYMNVNKDYIYSGYYYQTKNDLPCIRLLDEHMYCNIPCCNNSILFCLIGAREIRSHIENGFFKYPFLSFETHLKKEKSLT